ncbi:hypothetical protein C8Q79DRAFT_960967 [Trametes meyenii]|nr:hypothetical protein C8Q79DRAFT_960967 [Trametes meyenii]
MTATPYIEVQEWHYTASPQYTSSTRGDTSTPHAYAYPQKRIADKMDHRDFSTRLHGKTKLPPVADWPTNTSNLRATSDSRQLSPHDERHPQECAPRQPPTSPWESRTYQYAPSVNAPAPSLGGSMRLQTTTATWGLNGAFSFAGSWPSARAAPSLSATPAESRAPSSDRRSDIGDGGSSEDMRESLPSSRRRPSDMLPLVPNRAPALSESDIILLAANSSRQPTASSSDRRRERAVSPAGERVQLPPIRELGVQRRSIDYSPHPRAAAALAHGASVQLPSFPDFVQGSSRASFAASTSRDGRRDTVSPPPSPSPSVASFCTNARSGDFTDTEPTEEEDVTMGEYKRPGSFPPPAAMHPSRAMSLEVGAHVVRRPPSPARPSPPLDGEFANPAAPPVTPGASIVTSTLEVHMEDGLRPSGRGRKQDQSSISGTRRRARARPTEAKEPPQKKYRFVASKLSNDLLPPSEARHVDAVERERSPSARGGGSKRKLSVSIPPSSPASSEDIPLSATTTCPKTKPHAERETRPEPQPASEPPKRRGRPPRPAYDVESIAPIDPDSPEAKGQFPEYRYVGEQGPMPCKFDGCNVQLSGKKAELTTHFKFHFHTVNGRALVCPWETKNRHGVYEPCGQTFRDSANMGRHVSTRHMKVEGYECGRCGRAFARRDATLRHMKTMCSPDKQRRRAARRRSESDEWEDEVNDADYSGSSKDDEGLGQD